jgi:hypothetical protein
MQSRQTIRQIRAAIAAILVLLLGSTSIHADRILVIGDSGAAPLAAELQIVLHENGHTDITVDATPYIGTSSHMRTTARLNDITEWLDERLDVIVVQINIGGNDWSNSDWTPSWANTASERSLIEGIIQNVEIVVDHIFSLRPDIQILWKSFEFPRPISRGTPVEINNFQITMDKQRAQFAATKPGLSFVDVKGTLQVAYGFDGVQHTQFDPSFVIPPGDPSLPDPGFPSPYEAFLPGDLWHKTPEGYRLLTQAQYDLFYEPLLNGQDFQINSGLNDAWFNLATNGQGFLITVFPDRKEMFLAWFTFDTEQGDMANLTIFVTEGGVFDAVEPVAETDPAGDGTITIEFADCTEGIVKYEIASLGISGEIPIQRITPDNVPLCEALEELLLHK